MLNVRMIGLAAWMAMSSSSISANAVEIINSRIDNVGNLVLDVADEPPPVPVLNYRVRARAAATYVCATAAGVPHFLIPSRTIESTVNDSVLLSVGAGGGIRDFATLALPRDRVTFGCPRGFSVQLASVVYSQIQVRNPFGSVAYARDDVRVFIHIE